MALSLTDKLVGFIVRPVETFRAVRDEELAPPAIYYLVLLIINAILSAIVAYLGFGAATNNTPGIGAFIAGLIAAFILGIISLILISIFLHLGARIMGGHGDFADSFKSTIYSLTPQMLLGWIPIIGFIFTIWSLVLLVLGVRELHELDTMKAIIAVVIAVVIILVIAIILGIIFGLAILSIIGLSGMPGVVPTG